MSGLNNNWITEYEYSHPLKEVQTGDAKTLYINSTIAYSYFRDVKFFYPELISEAGENILLLHTVAPQDWYGNPYKLYQHSRNGKKVFFIPLPKHLRSAIARSKRKVMYKVKIMLNSNADKVIVIENYGGKI